MVKKLTLLLTLTALFQAALWASNAPETVSSLTSVTRHELSILETKHKEAEELVIKNDFRGAIRVYEEITFMEPDDEVAYTRMGQLYMVLGQDDDAGESFRNALDINPGNFVAIQGIQKIIDPDGVRGLISSATPDLEDLADPTAMELPVSEDGMLTVPNPEEEPAPTA